MPKTTSDAIDNSLLGELAHGAQKAFENAEALFNEASILRGAGALSRALFLHQISLEECAKVEILGGWATSLLMGHKVDVAKVKKAMASHAQKNRTNAYLLKSSPEENAAKRSGDVDGAVKAFTKMQQEFHSRANTAKNTSLYVDFAEGTFVAPNERITSEMVADTATLNEEFLALSFPKLEMLRKWTAHPELITEELVGFEKRITELADQYPDDPMMAMEVLLRELLERHRETARKMQE